MDIAQVWGESYLLFARVGASRHLFMLISAIAMSRDIVTKEKLSFMSDISELVNSICGEAIDDVLSQLRIDYSLSIRCVAHGWLCLSMLFSGLSVGLYNLVNRFR